MRLHKNDILLFNNTSCRDWYVYIINVWTESVYERMFLRVHNS